MDILETFCHWINRDVAKHIRKKNCEVSQKWCKLIFGNLWNLQATIVIRLFKNLLTFETPVYFQWSYSVFKLYKWDERISMKHERSNLPADILKPASCWRSIFCLITHRGRGRVWDSPTLISDTVLSFSQKEHKNKVCQSEELALLSCTTKRSQETNILEEHSILSQKDRSGNDLHLYLKEQGSSFPPRT